MKITVFWFDTGPMLVSISLVLVGTEYLLGRCYIMGKTVAAAPSVWDHVIDAWPDVIPGYC